MYILTRYSVKEHEPAEFLRSSFQYCMLIVKILQCFVAMPVMMIHVFE